MWKDAIATLLRDFCEFQRQRHLDSLHHRACGGSDNEISHIAMQFAAVNRPQNAPAFEPEECGDPGSYDDGPNRI